MFLRRGDPAPEPTGIIYLCRLADGREYVGKTKGLLEHRRTAHRAAAKAGKRGKFHRALARDAARGEWSVIARVPLARLNDAERAEIIRRNPELNVNGRRR